MAKSSGDVGPGGGGGSRPPGDIFKRNIRESSANSKDTAKKIYIYKKRILKIKLK